MNVCRSRRWRVSALVVGTTLATVLGFGGVAAASAAPTGFVVDAGRLVLSSGAAHYTGAMAVSVRNSSRDPADARILVTEPPGLRFLGMGITVPCMVMEGYWECIVSPFAGGERRTVTLNFGSYAGPERFARVTAAATVAAVTPGATPDAAATDSYAGVLRSVSGSVRHPRFYTPSTAYDLALAASGDAVVTGDASGAVVGLPLVASDRTDAANDGAFVGVTIDGQRIMVLRVEPSAPCTHVCPVPGESDWMAKGEVRNFALFTMPAEIPAGTHLVQASGFMGLRGEAAVDLTPENNIVDFTVTVPAT